MGCLRNWVDMLVGMGLMNVVSVGPIKESVEHVLFECALSNSQRRFLDYLKQVLFPDTFEAFMHCRGVLCMAEFQLLRRETRYGSK